MTYKIDASSYLKSDEDFGKIDASSYLKSDEDFGKKTQPILGFLKLATFVEDFSEMSAILSNEESIGNKIKQFKELAQEIVDINAQLHWNDSKKTSYTLLDKAVVKNQVECVAILLENGANPEIKNSDGKTAIELAVQNEKISKLFQEHGGELSLKQIAHWRLMRNHCQVKIVLTVKFFFSIFFFSIFFSIFFFNVTM